MSAAVVKALGEFADAVEGIRYAVEALEDTVGPVPASADSKELRRAAHSLAAGALQIAGHAIEIARVGGVVESVASAKEAEAANG